MVEQVKNYPVLKGDGVVIWKNRSKKDGSPYYTVESLGCIKVNVFPYKIPEPKNKDNEITL